MTCLSDTQQRQQAINPHASFLVQAPAGSGKTELLIQRILALLAIVDEPEEILALTFTRKAAAEMRERVILALQAGLEPAPSAAHAKTTWDLAKAALEQSRRKQWRLTSYPARLRIMTIDAFASGLARQLPILSGFGNTPATAEFSQPLYQNAVISLMNYVTQKDTPQSIKDAFDTLTLHLDCKMQKLSDLLCAMLNNRDQWLPDVLAYAPDMPTLRQHLSHSLSLVIEHSLQQASQSMPVAIRDALIPLGHYAAAQLQSEYGDKHALLALSNLHHLPQADMQDLAKWKAWASLLLKTDGHFRVSVDKRQGFPNDTAGKVHKQTMLDLLDSLQCNEALRQALLQIRHLPDTATIDDASWQVLSALFILLHLLAAMLWQTFAQHKQVDFLEIMLRAKQALGANSHHHQQPSETLLRLDYQIKHILLDEFQDTNQLQIDMLSCLTSGWAADDGRTLFMVGDPMQSIYRFRKAEVNLFLRAANNDLELPPITFLSLSQNFRSEPAIVDWVNKAFHQILPANNDVIAGAIRYSPSQAFKAQTGKVHVQVYADKNDAQEAEDVLKLVQEGLIKKQRIGILARSRSHLHRIMATLQAANIAFRAIDILPLHQQSEIIDLRSLTAALVHPGDDVAWAALLRLPVVGLSLPTLMDLFGQAPHTVWEKIKCFAAIATGDEQHRLRHLMDALSPCLDQAGRLPWRQLVETAWLRLHIPATLQAHQIANANVFFQLVDTLSAEGQLDLQILETRLSAVYAQSESKPMAEYVELTTMHGAKGLQWDRVILPGLGKISRASDKPLLSQTYLNTHAGQQLLIAPLPQYGDSAIYDLIADIEKQRDKLEIARLLYVACTRAEAELFILGHVSGKEALPQKSSLLALLWQDESQCYGADIVCKEAAATTPHIHSAKPHALMVVSSNYQAPAPHPAIATTRSQPSPADNNRPEFSWAGASARAVGIALHAGLQNLAEMMAETTSEIDLSAWNKQQIQAHKQLMRSILQREGISALRIDDALQQCRVGLAQCLQSKRAAWILSNQHQDAHHEWGLSFVDAGEVKHIVLDRSFIDADGTRWVIDYKTGHHQGSDIEAFLDHELHRYSVETPQLPTYVRALRALEPERKIKAALYFPMMDGWRVWQED